MSKETKRFDKEKQAVNKYVEQYHSFSSIVHLSLTKQFIDEYLIRTWNASFYVRRANELKERISSIDWVEPKKISQSDIRCPKNISFCHEYKGQIIWNKWNLHLNYISDCYDLKLFDFLTDIYAIQSYNSQNV